MPQAVGSGAALWDFDGDGRLDVYLIQNGGPDGQANRLLQQQPDGSFRDVSAGSGLDVAGWGMGAATGDVNNDGRVDLALFEFGRTRLFLNAGNGRFVDVSGPSGVTNPLWAVSGAFFDYDRDGWLDLVVVNYVDYDPTWPCSSAGGERDYCSPSVFAGTASRLYRNAGPVAAVDGASTDGSADGSAEGLLPELTSVTFDDVSVPSGIGRKVGPGLGVYCADFTADGWPDVFVANDGQYNSLWVNQHDGTFVDEAVLRGLACNGFGRAEADMGLAFGDVDADGWADVFATHLTSETHTLWLQGPPGHYADQTVPRGLSAGGRGTGFGTAMADFDLDGDLDLAVATGRVARGPAADNPNLSPHWREYAEPNQVFRNDGRGRFTDVSADNAALCGKPDVSRGLALGDVNNDGLPDLLVTTIDGPARILQTVPPPRGRHWLAVRAVLSEHPRDALGACIRLRAGKREWTRVLTSGGSFACANDPRVHFGLGEVTQIDELIVQWPDGRTESFPPPDVDQEIRLEQGQGHPVEAAAESPK